MGQMTDIYVPRQTRHRESPAPWVTSHTPNLRKQLKTHKSLLKRKPYSYQKQQAQKLMNLITNCSE